MSWGSSEEQLLTKNRSPLAAAVAVGRSSPPGNLGAPVLGRVVDVASPPSELHLGGGEAEQYTFTGAPKPQVRRQHSLPRRIAAPFERPIARARSPLQTAVHRGWHRASGSPDSPSWRRKRSETSEGSTDGNTVMNGDGYSSSSDELTCVTRPHRRRSPPAAVVAALNGVVADCSAVGRTEPVTAPAVRTSWPSAGLPTPKPGSSAAVGRGNDTDARPPIPPVDAPPLFTFGTPSASPVFNSFDASTASSGAASPTVWNSGSPSFPTSPSLRSLPGSPFNNSLRNSSLSDPAWTASLSSLDEGKNYTRPSQHIRRNRSPSLVGHTHIRSVTRRSSLLPKTKCINRILSVLDVCEKICALRCGFIHGFRVRGRFLPHVLNTPFGRTQEEARPIENELAREREANEAIKQETKLRIDECMGESVQPWSVSLKDIPPVSSYSQLKRNPDMDVILAMRTDAFADSVGISLYAELAPLDCAVKAERCERAALVRKYSRHILSVNERTTCLSAVASDERVELSGAMKRRAVSPAVNNATAGTVVQSSSASCSVAGTPCSSASSETSPPLPPLDGGTVGLAVPPMNMTGPYEFAAAAGTGGAEGRTNTTAGTSGRKDSMKIVNVHGASRSLARMRLE
ncbi:MAG: hypothetical protein BJ554DRAFT_8020 [Olpidium bornovanus]|uniref:Uncharacterized protein n=1 Tax=Olpidium bornovanus TaxID=278681 RepID=A0A8H7ZVM0_9FUNG|nr:MAG: hypothetical protein BJ554DRAFT_8020 [Olpidium bornovanus]